MPRRIAVLTTGRQDYGILRFLCQELHAAPDFELSLLVGGTHLSPIFGKTIKEIEEDDLPICEKIDIVPASDSAVAAAQSAGLMTMLMPGALERQHPDVLVVVGDRYETLAAVIAATVMKTPVVHLHGGEETEGAIDNNIRHAITKLSHLHFVSNTLHAQRVQQMGEETERVFVVGAPGLDAIRRLPFLSRSELERAIGISLTPPVLTVTYHPTTLGSVSAQEEINAILDALSTFNGAVIFTLPNADPGNGAIRKAILQFVERRSKSYAFDALGSLRYLSLLKHTDAMVGNSSSGLIEAPLFGLPTVNVGDRQKGRVRGVNVIDAPPDPQAIGDALCRSLSLTFRESLRDMESPYGDGRATERIIALLRRVAVTPALLQKRFLSFGEGR